MKWLTSLAAKLSVPVATAYIWTSQCNVPDTRGGSRFNLIVEKHKEFMVDLIEHNSRITLQEIVDHLRVKFDLGLSKQLFAGTLTRQLILSRRFDLNLKGPIHKKIRSSIKVPPAE